MKKIPTLFKRNLGGDNLVRDEVTPGCEWVLQGEGIPYQKFDGSCCLVRDGKLYKRYDAKAFTVNPTTGEKFPYKRKPPEGFEPCQQPDENTGHWPGWVPVGDGPEDQWHREAWEKLPFAEDGTYELCGPKIGTNREKLDSHVLLSHKSSPIWGVIRSFDHLKQLFQDQPWEGFVFHHPDGRMCKIKVSDFWKNSHPTIKEVEGNHYLLEGNGTKRRVCIRVEIPEDVDWQVVGREAIAAATSNINKQVLANQTVVSAACAMGGGW